MASATWRKYRTQLRVATAIMVSFTTRTTILPRLLVAVVFDVDVVVAVFRGVVSTLGLWMIGMVCRCSVMDLIQKL